jgi:arsenite-transporting ATPase
LRLVLFGGTGGVGTTTVAAATATLAARSAKVLLVSDGVAAGAAAAGGPVAVDPVPMRDVQVLRVDARAAFERRWPGAAGLALPPGAAGLLTLLEVHERATGGNWDAVLVDGPAVDTLLALDGLAGTLEQLWPEHTRIMHRSASTDAVGSIQAALTTVADLLSTTSVRLVLDPTPAGVAAAQDALTALALHGYPVDAVVANRLLPDEAGDTPWARTVRAAQADALAALEPGVPLRRAPYLPVPPAGPEHLAALGLTLYGRDDPLAPAAAAPAPAVVRTRAGYELRLALPYLRRSQVRLARAGDELVLTVGGRLRRLPLPSVLRRCVAVGASAADGVLRVRFRPDPALWPAELVP